MNCPCGYNFAEDSRRSIETGTRESESYAVIRNEDYTSVVKLELKVLESRDPQSRLKSIARAAERVGSAKVCPVCSRLSLIKPVSLDLVVYSREEK